MKPAVEVAFMKILKQIMRNSLTITILLVSLGAAAQELIPIRTWRSHFNYEETKLVEKTENKIFAATTQGLIYYDSEDQSINRLSKIDGLSDAGITAMAYNSEGQMLVLGYETGNVDVITTEGIQNLPALLNSDITENKKINQISFYRGMINLSTDFGLLVLTEENKIQEAYLNLGAAGQITKVRSSAILNDVMFLATEVGVLSGVLNSGDNLQDFNNWERYDGSLVHANDIIAVASSNAEMYALSMTSLYKLVGNTWLQVAYGLNAEESFTGIRNGMNGLLIRTNLRTLLLDESDTFTALSLPTGAAVNDILQENETVYWYADQSKGLSRLHQSEVTHMVLNGPLSNAEKVKFQAGSIYAMPAINTNITAPLSNGLGYSKFDEGQWSTLRPEDLEGFSNITDVLTTNDATLITSFGNGLLNLQSGEVVNYTNSPLDEIESGTGNTLVTAMTRDENNNIWLANFGNYSLLRRNDEELWDRFDLGFQAAEPISMGINSNNQLWMSLGLTEGSGILAYDIESASSRYLTTSATSLPSNQVYDIAFGKDGEVWFATDQGVAYFPFSFGVIQDQTIDVSLPVFEESTLFDGKEVYALTVDGGNRVWMGTSEGLWLFEDNASELLEHFTVNNSPLPSNRILDLVINPATGELFIATDNGMVSYRTNATDATNKHQQVRIFPNPVLPDFDGWVGLSGLASDVGIKITTIAGHLIREVRAQGGAASWDLKDYTGRRVGTGVYLMFSASDDGSETFVGKIAVVD